ncbi:filamentous hemagglutinin N-terminal domain-containing protein [Erwinia typographi]|uniref:filamentous hemagglutinin N-terminal domain-containing protein n=1 Tax=Erwinia typographi TaxID=371042 RepID=UPI00068EA052|nr:filamentous hemagglutinin N-terminal domain-containing protein [Erwinia typographi]
MNAKFNLLSLTTTAALLSGAVYADSNSPSYIHTSGATVININKTNANGLSHNMLKEFNVGPKGTILNNSIEDIYRPNGNIPKNRKLNESAKVILNEVISNKASKLNGFLEVAGQRADVIIANPNGITCSGCSFINSNRVTLSTGTPVFKDGALTNYNVLKGKITIENSGLKNLNSFTDILAEKIILNGKVETGALNAVAGMYQYTVANGDIKPLAQYQGTGIDVKSLGGVTADQIVLVSTSAGVGVNNTGILQSDKIFISASGAITNAGSMKADSINLTSVKNIENSSTGELASNTGNIVINANQDIRNSGNIKSENAILINSGSIGGESSPVFFSSINNLGTISGKNAVLLTATNSVNNDKGSITSTGKTTVVAMKVNNRTEISGGEVDISSLGLENTGLISATNDMSIYGKNAITNYGTLKSKTLTLKTDGEILMAKCFLWFACQNGTVKADLLKVEAPKIKTVDEMSGNLEVKEIKLNTAEEPEDLDETEMPEELKAA